MELYAPVLRKKIEHLFILNVSISQAKFEYHILIFLEFTSIVLELNI